MHGAIKKINRRILKQKKTEILPRIQEIIETYEANISNENIDYIPANIEFQIKTAKVAKKAISGTASHHEYKGEDPDEIQRRYNDNPESFIPGKTISIMWKSDIGVDGRRNMRLLSEEEVLKKEHPYLKISGQDRDDH